MANKNASENHTESEIAAEIRRVLSNDKMTIRGFYMIVTTTAIFGLIGGLIGWIFALVTPAYFRDVYDSIDREIWQVAVGMGVKWGLICGVFASSSVLISVAWYRSRIKNYLVDKYRVNEG